MVLRSILYNLH